MFEWFIICVPETLVFLAFLKHMLKSEINIFPATLIIAAVMATGRVLFNNDVMFNTVISFATYVVVIKFFTKSKITKILKYLSVIVVYAIIIDSSLVVMLKYLSGKDFQSVAENKEMFFLLTMYAAILKALLLPYYVKLKERKCC